jgi:hypothetical protein
VSIKVHTIEGDLVPLGKKDRGLADLFADISDLCGPGSHPLRFAITNMSGDFWRSEIDVMQSAEHASIPSIFSFRRRSYERTKAFNALMVVPTGIDCAAGGHAGDATPAARVLASLCDHLVVNPNVVNASDINEQTDNMLYVEGSVICRLLMGTIALRKVRSNRVLVVTEARDDGDWFVDQVVNTTNAARAVLGVDCSKVVVLKHGPLIKMMRSSSGRAIGEIVNLESLFAMLAAERPNYDAVALSTKVTPGTDIRRLFQSYFREDGPNPWGGAEAALTHAVSTLFDVPSAHAPTLEENSLRAESLGQVDPRKAAEAISTSYFFSVLKGLSRAPAVVPSAVEFNDPEVLAAEDISCLVIPDKCVGLPTLAALAQGIQVIAVCGNTNLMKNYLERLPFAPGRLWFVENYLEAAGVIAAMKVGVHPLTVKRPLDRTGVVVV